MTTILFDLESDGLLADMTKIHCIAISEDRAAPKLYEPIQFEEALGILSKADILVGHNSIAFDVPALKKILGWVPSSHTKHYDTFIASQLLFPQLAERSMSLPPSLRGSHGLQAWGLRLKVNKGDYQGPWDVPSKEMFDYCVQDVQVLIAIYNRFMRDAYPEPAVATEMELAPVISQMVEHGFKFDVNKAQDLHAMLLAARVEMGDKLQKEFPIRCIAIEEKVAKINSKLYTKGAPYTVIEFEEFNPNSRKQIISRLKDKYKWHPKEFTELGSPIIDEDTLNALPYPEAQTLASYFTIQKRIGQLADGRNGWLRLVDANNRIHGKYMQCGTLTGRATHFNPNISQVPSGRLLYGKECRELFIADKGKVLVGVDLASLELRCLAGYMKPFDNGSMIQSVLYGTKENRTDVYSLAADALGLTRDTGKTLVLALIYGAGLKKLAWTVNPNLSEDSAVKYGAEIRTTIETSLDGYELLVNAVQAKLKAVGFLSGLDKRKLIPRSDYSALNTLLQSAGAVIAKRFVIIGNELLTSNSLIANIVVWSHDEVVVECVPEHAEQVKDLFIKAAKLSGEFYNFPCPMDGEGKIGRNWLEIH